MQAELEYVFIEEFSEKAGSQSKNKRTWPYINLYLDVSLSANAEQSLDLSSLSASDFIVRDDRRRRYEVIIIEPAESSIDAGQKTALRLVTDGAPNKLFGTRNLSLTILPEALGSELSFDINYREVDKKSISKKY